MADNKVYSWWESTKSAVCGVAYKACEKGKETVSKASETVKEAAKEVREWNSIRMMCTNFKYGVRAIAAATMDGTGELLKDAKGIVQLKNVESCVEKVADWAKPCVGAAKWVGRGCSVVKAITIGDSVRELTQEGKCTKLVSTVGSMALGYAASAAAGALLVATPVGWAAAGVFVAGAAGAYVGSKIGSWTGHQIDENVLSPSAEKKAQSASSSKPVVQPSQPQNHEEIKRVLDKNSNVIPEERPALNPVNGAPLIEIRKAQIPFKVIESLDVPSCGVMQNNAYNTKNLPTLQSPNR